MKKATFFLLLLLASTGSRVWCQTYPTPDAPEAKTGDADTAKAKTLFLPPPPFGLLQVTSPDTLAFLAVNTDTVGTAGHFETTSLTNYKPTLEVVSNSGYAIKATSPFHGLAFLGATAPAGVKGEATLGFTFGVHGLNLSTTNFAAGVRGQATGLSGETYGVHGTNDSNTDVSAGVKGDAEGLTGRTYGVFGTNFSTSTGAAGVRGAMGSLTGETFGILGTNPSTTDFAAAVRGSALGLMGRTYGVQGTNPSTTDFAAGVRGDATSLMGRTYGVQGTNPSTTDFAAGVRGEALGMTGLTLGVLGTSASTSDFAAGIRGEATGATGRIFGVHGASHSVASNAAGVLAIGNGAAGNGMPRAAALEVRSGAIRVTGTPKPTGSAVINTFFEILSSTEYPTDPYPHCHTIGCYGDTVINNDLIVAGSQIFLSVDEDVIPTPGKSCSAQILTKAPGTATIRATVFGYGCQMPTYGCQGEVQVHYLIINP